jgi:hypothetical protein
MALTSVQSLFDAFLALIESDEWEALEEFQAQIDFKQLALAAKPWFKFPRCSLEWDEDGKNFIDENMSNDEIQVLALFMKSLWYDRVVDSWENLRPYYTERDFSPGKMLGEFRGRASEQLKKAKALESVYYRSIKGKPFDYSKLSGG